MRTGIGEANSVRKFAEQVRVVATQPFTINGKCYQPAPATIVSAAFWRTFGCYLGCGGCCAAFTLDWTPDEWNAMSSLYPDAADDADVQMVDVNGVPHPIVTVVQTRAWERHGRLFCQYLDPQDGGCTIHRANPFSCRVELIRLSVRGTNGYIYKGPFGRAWNMTPLSGERGRILCDFTPWTAEQFWQNDVPVLRRLDHWASYLGIPTRLDRVIAQLERMVRDDLPRQRLVVR